MKKTIQEAISNIIGILWLIPTMVCFFIAKFSLLAIHGAICIYGALYPPENEDDVKGYNRLVDLFACRFNDVFEDLYIHADDKEDLFSQVL